MLFFLVVEILERVPRPYRRLLNTDMEHAPSLGLYLISGAMAIAPGIKYELSHGTAHRQA